MPNIRAIDMLLLEDLLGDRRDCQSRHCQSLYRLQTLCALLVPLKLEASSVTAR